MREALVITNATHKSRLKRKVEEGSTLLVRAARDVVKGDHLDKIVELVKAPEDVDARSRTILAAAALALAQTRARVPVVVVERDDRTVVIRGASAARSSRRCAHFQSPLPARRRCPLPLRPQPLRSLHFAAVPLGPAKRFSAPLFSRWLSSEGSED